MKARKIHLRKQVTRVMLHRVEAIRTGQIVYVASKAACDIYCARGNALFDVPRFVVVEHQMIVKKV